MAVTTKTFYVSTIDNFLAVRSDKSLDLSTIKIVGTPTITTLIAEATIGGSNIRLEATGTFSNAVRSQVKTLADFYKADALVSNTKIYIDNILDQEQIFSPAVKPSDFIESEYSLAKLTALYSGNDIFVGNPAKVQTAGDSLNGYGGDDIFYGNGNGQYDDIFHGGSGKDTSVYRGKLANYAIKASDVWDPVAQKPT